MNFKKSKIKSKIESISTSISSILIPIFQYVPCTTIWKGIMSVPLITYFIYFFQNPRILRYDVQFLFQNHAIYFIIFGVIMYIYSLIYQLTHRKQLIQTGPYKYLRHPQYLAFIIMTFGMTLIAFQTSPIFEFDIGDFNGYTLIFYIWIGELLAYIILAKIEEIALKAKYGNNFLEYANEVPFMFPFLRLNRNLNYSSKRGKNYSRFFLVKFVLIVISLVLLSIILGRLVESYREPVFGDDESTIGIIIISISITTILLLSIMEVLTIKEYKGYFLRKHHFKRGKSYLSLSDIFENENRIKILNQILNNPGVHHNELLRNCDLQKGQLQWHLDVLLKNHIIKKEKYGQYTIYYPILSSFETDDNLKYLNLKSKTTSEVLNIIEENPGINSSEISRLLNLSRTTIKYHIDKLSEENIIKLVKKGRKIELYPY
ncbi:MAG: winged helix-turn-helix transcriptional regulator [Candidatus Hodarchaeota archaeon]